MKKLIKIVLTLFTVFFFAASILLLVLGTLAAQSNSYIKLFNHSYSVVGSGSMEPTIMTGEFIIIEYVSYDSVYQMVLDGETPIIAFKTDKNIVHRAIAVEDNHIITKGDNNPSSDSGYVDETNFIGIVTSHFMLLNLGSITLNYKHVVFLVIIVILLFMLIKEFITIIETYKKRENMKMEETHELEKEKWINEEKARLREELKKELEAKSKK